MAENDRKSSRSDQFVTTYTVDEAPKLPDANVTTVRPDPVIDTKLIEARNAEAKKNADAVK